MDRVADWVDRTHHAASVEPRTAAKLLTPGPARSGVIDLTDSDDEGSPAPSSALSFHSVHQELPLNKPFAPVFAAPRALDPAPTGHPTLARSDPLRPLDNGAYRDPFAQGAAMSAKAKAMAAMQADQARLNLPKPVPRAIAIGVPQNAPYRPPGLAAVDEDEEALKKAMGQLDIGENLSAADQEHALKSLLESAMDLDGVDTTAEAPAELKTKLFPHQVLGLHWLKDRELGKKRGGILGDDVSPVLDEHRGLALTFLVRRWDSARLFV